MTTIIVLWGGIVANGNDMAQIYLNNISIIEGKSATAEISLKSNTNVRDVMFDLYVPEGVTLESIALNSDIKGHQLMINKIDSLSSTKVTRIAIVSDKADILLYENSISLLTLQLKGNKITESSLQFKGISISLDNENTIIQEDMSIQLDVVADVDAENEEYKRICDLINQQQETFATIYVPEGDEKTQQCVTKYNECLSASQNYADSLHAEIVSLKHIAENEANITKIKSCIDDLKEAIDVYRKSIKENNDKVVEAIIQNSDDALKLNDEFLDGINALSGCKSIDFSEKINLAADSIARINEKIKAVVADAIDDGNNGVDNFEFIYILDYTNKIDSLSTVSQQVYDVFVAETERMAERYFTTAYNEKHSEYIRTKAQVADYNNESLSLDAFYDVLTELDAIKESVVVDVNDGCLAENLDTYIQQIDGIDMDEVAKEAEKEMNEIEETSTVGELDGHDIAYIHSLENLNSLDISNSKIVEGGGTYDGEHYTSNDEIGDYMFANMPNLKTLVIGDNIKKIGECILYNTNNVSTLTIPSNVESVKDKALEGDSGLRYVTWQSTTAEIPDNLFGSTDQNVLVYAPKGVTSSRKTNVIVDGMADNVVLTDNVPLTIPEAFKAKKIEYTRDFTKITVKGKASGWEGLVLPFDVQTISSEKNGEIVPYGTYKEGAAHFWLAGANEGILANVTSIKANEPYVISMPNSIDYPDIYNISGKVTFSAEDASNGVSVESTKDAKTETVGNYSLVPAYEAVEQSESIYTLNEEEYETYEAGGVFVKNVRDVKPFECYLYYNGTSEARKRCVSISSLFTKEDGIEAIETDTDGTAGRYYNLSGQRLNTALNHGLYISKGKCVIAK